MCEEFSATCEEFFVACQDCCVTEKKFYVSYQDYGVLKNHWYVTEKSGSVTFFVAASAPRSARRLPVSMSSESRRPR